MKKSIIRSLAFILSLIIVLSLAACGESAAPAADTAETPSPEPVPEATLEPTPEPAPEWDLGGRTIVLGDWWSGTEWNWGTPADTWGEMVQSYRKALCEEMNFQFAQIGIQNQGDFNEVLTNSFISGEPVCDCFYAQPSQIVAMASQGLLWDLNKLVDFDKYPFWAEDVREFYTIGDACYAARPEADQSRFGFYFNKRIFQEAGIDPESIYDMQQNGEWTWDKFDELCAKLTQDTDNDGEIDIYAIGCWSADLLSAAIYSNGATWAKKEGGKVVDGTTDPRFLAGCEFCTKLYESGYVLPQGDQHTEFANGKVAMALGEDWVITSYYSNMEDEWGFVFFPAGPEGGLIAAMFPTPIAIPACIPEERAREVAEVICRWFDTSAVPGAEDIMPDFRDGYYWKFRDTRGVDETVYMMVAEPEHHVYDVAKLVPGAGDAAWAISQHCCNALDMTAAQAIESYRPTLQSQIDAFNKMFE